MGSYRPFNGGVFVMVEGLTCSVYRGRLEYPFVGKEVSSRRFQPVSKRQLCDVDAAPV